MLSDPSFKTDLIAEKNMHYTLKLECPEIMIIIAIIGLFLTVFPNILVKKIL